MPLLCGLGWHRVDPIARWNNGYYFSKCRRCGHDLVRTTYDGWRIPKGYKVVWRAKAPEDLDAVELVLDQQFALDDSNESQDILPIQKVLRHLKARDAEPHGSDNAPSETKPPPPQPRRNSATRDFMDDDPKGGSW